MGRWAKKVVALEDEEVVFYTPALAKTVLKLTLGPNGSVTPSPSSSFLRAIGCTGTNSLDALKIYTLNWGNCGGDTVTYALAHSTEVFR